MKNQLAYWIGIGLVALLCFFRIPMPFTYQIDQKIDPLFQSFPTQLGAWAGEDTEVDEKTYEILETRNVLSRTYQNKTGAEIHLLLVSSNKDRRVAHPPEVCYLGSNFFITDAKERNIPIQGAELPVKEFIAKSERHPDDEQHVMYVYKIGDQFTTNYYSQQLRFAIDHLSQSNSRIFLIRIAAKE